MSSDNPTTKSKAESKPRPKIDTKTEVKLDAKGAFIREVAIQFLIAGNTLTPDQYQEIATKLGTSVNACRIRMTGLKKEFDIPLAMGKTKGEATPDGTPKKTRAKKRTADGDGDSPTKKPKGATKVEKCEIDDAVKMVGTEDSGLEVGEDEEDFV